MLCSEAGDERVSEQGRAVRARARRLPSRARPPVRRRRARPYANKPGVGGAGRRPGVPARKGSWLGGPPTCHTGEGDAPPTGKTGVLAVGFRRAAWLLTAESPPGKPQVS